MVGNDYWMWNNNLKWFDGYNMQEDVIFDDLRIETHEDYVKLLRLLDGYVCKVERKGGIISFQPKRIIVTNINGPHGFGIIENNEQLLRRIGNIIKL